MRPVGITNGKDIKFMETVYLRLGNSHYSTGPNTIIHSHPLYTAGAHRQKHTNTEI